MMKNNLDSMQLAAISKLFSANVLQEMTLKGRFDGFASLVKDTSLANSIDNEILVADFYEIMFNKLKKIKNRQEYVYKSAIVQKVLLGKHSLKTSSLLSEFRVENCKADIAVLNGTSTVYEVKSERDKLTRLDRQIAAYSKFFASVNVIVGENHLDAVKLTVPRGVGIMTLSKNFTICIEREADNNPGRTCPSTIFDSIRKDESIKILNAIGVSIPDVPNSRLYMEMRRLFSLQDPESIHYHMVRVLRETRDLSFLYSEIKKVPKSLHAAVLSMPLKINQVANLGQATNTSLTEALKWN